MEIIHCGLGIAAQGNEDTLAPARKFRQAYQVISAQAEVEGGVSAGRAAEECFRHAARRFEPAEDLAGQSRIPNSRIWVSHGLPG